ncbi:uncharacterized protein FOMMEDRAFT_153817 [Fomitiporia mediterranea MF3/22]|uniref:uncharacterized protein n=1 Tax=Fomitiporia mediterranea (strain MF3/22) TaxID=694068 RepID=UPI00044099F8|nr:uncharacterized protein FOMMEDRAFT_153817 [Fomitiporia mediterranea MF3/22]EJD04742.1 hypothetical protein FOMMEDRAFT_153817 [Fomitiporia mediterranea MF3/22]
MPMPISLCLYIGLNYGTVSGSIDLTQSMKLEFLSFEGQFPYFEDWTMPLSTRSVAFDFDLTVQQCCELLKANPNLKKLRAVDILLKYNNKDRSIISHNLEQLRFLTLDNGAVGGILSLAQSPKIEHLSLGGIRLLRFKREPALLSARSALFDITSIRTVQQCRKFLEATPNLKSLQHNEIRGPTHDEDSPVILHNLNRLSLSGPAPHLLIDKLALPALTELDYRDLETWNGGEILSTFIQRSLPPLTSLVIGGNCADEDTIISILPLLPLLKMLNLFACTISAQLFDILSIPGDPNAVLLAQDTSDRITCPDMRHFSLYNYIVVGEARECANALCTMLESRWNVLRLWDDLVDIQGTRYPFFASDRRRLRRHIREGRLFRARCSSYSIPD